MRDRKRYIKFDVRAFWRLTMGWEPERIGVMMRLLERVWTSQKQFPADLLEKPSPSIRMITGMDARTVRKHYDDSMRAALLKLSSQRTPLTPDIRKHALAKAGGCCAYCKEELGELYHVDHIIPVSAGGLSHRDNLIAACPSCNLAKGARV